MNKNVSVWRGNSTPPTNYHLWIKNNNLYIYNDSNWELVSNKQDIFNKIGWSILSCDYVDLGLPSGTMWSTFNVGATKPEELGGYYSWGETKEKDNYNWETYNLARNPNLLLKYCTSSEFGRVDNKIIIEPIDDTACVRWGELWRMPTLLETLELIEYCSKKSVVINNINCFELTGPNGNKLIFPKAGFYNNTELKNLQCAYFWTNSISDTNNQKAFLTLLLENNTMSVVPNDRSYGCSIRPVLAINWSIEGEILTTTNGKLDLETLEVSTGTVENEILNL